MKDESGERFGFPFSCVRSPHPTLCERTAKVRLSGKLKKKNKNLLISDLDLRGCELDFSGGNRGSKKMSSLLIKSDGPIRGVKGE
jgi:hypothetical protein